MGITARRTRTWKWFNNPFYEEKKQWVLGRLQRGRGQHPGRVLICFDDCVGHLVSPLSRPRLVRPKANGQRRRTR
jgi:hypothetical protein